MNSNACASVICATICHPAQRPCHSRCHFVAPRVICLAAQASAQKKAGSMLSQPRWW